MKKKLTFPAGQATTQKIGSPVVQRIKSSSGKPVIIVSGQRLPKGNAHLNDVKAIFAKEASDTKR